MKLSLLHLTSISMVALGHLYSSLRGQPEHHAEVHELERLHAHALAEGGRLVVWAGGDAPNQMDWYRDAFHRRFPGIDLQILVDLSRHHDLRIDAELASNTLTPDIALLHTTFDFEHWKRRGVLLNYRPLGAHQQSAGYADPDGAWITAWNNALVPTYSSSLPPHQHPRSYDDFLSAHLHARLLLASPHDDDAVLYLYDRLQRAYGTRYLIQLAALKPTFMRGTAVPAGLIGRTPGHAANLTGHLLEPGCADPVRMWLPRRAPLAVWNQRMAIFKASRHPFAARLLLAWTASFEFQSTLPTWRAREDVGPPPGLPPLSCLRGADVAGFTCWMADRRRVHLLRAQMRELFGSVDGASPLRDPELLRHLGLGEKDVVAPPAPETPPY